MNHSHSFYFLLPLGMVKTPDITASKCLTAGIWTSQRFFSIVVQDHDIVGHILSFGTPGHFRPEDKDREYCHGSSHYSRINN